jgi:hypothetical protein
MPPVRGDFCRVVPPPDWQGLGYSNRRIARETGIEPDTAGRYVELTKAEAVEPVPLAASSSNPCGGMRVQTGMSAVGQNAAVGLRISATMEVDISYAFQNDLCFLGATRASRTFAADGNECIERLICTQMLSVGACTDSLLGIQTPTSGLIWGHRSAIARAHSGLSSSRR